MTHTVEITYQYTFCGHKLIIEKLFSFYSFLPFYRLPCSWGDFMYFTVLYHFLLGGNTFLENGNITIRSALKNCIYDVVDVVGNSFFVWKVFALIWMVFFQFFSVLPFYLDGKYISRKWKYYHQNRLEKLYIPCGWHDGKLKKVLGRYFHLWKEFPLFEFTVYFQFMSFILF